MFMSWDPAYYAILVCNELDLISTGQCAEARSTAFRISMPPLVALQEYTLRCGQLKYDFYDRRVAIRAAENIIRLQSFV